MVRTRFFRRRSLRVAVPSLALCGVLAGVALFASSTARATACGSAVTAPGSCDVTGTLNLSAGSLTMTAPSVFGWTAGLTGLQQYVADVTTAHQSLIVNDATGSASGWNVTASAAQFTSGSDTLPLSAFSLNGSTSSATTGTTPTVGCTGGDTTCTAAITDVTYPVTDIETSPKKIFNATITPSPTGLGSNTVSSLGWWLSIPANAVPGVYTAAVTLAVSSGP